MCLVCYNNYYYSIIIFYEHLLNLYYHRVWNHLLIILGIHYLPLTSPYMCSQLNHIPLSRQCLLDLWVSSTIVLEILFIQNTEHLSFGIFCIEVACSIYRQEITYFKHIKHGTLIIKNTNMILSMQKIWHKNKGKQMYLRQKLSMMESMIHYYMCLFYAELCTHRKKTLYISQVLR